MGTPPSWNNLFEDPRFHWKQPDEGVVALSAQWRAEGRRRLLDLGCGAGRHLAFLQTQGFAVDGMDAAPNGLEACAAAMVEAGLAARLVRADMTRLPFVDASFDAGIATNVLNHNPRGLLQMAVDDVYRVLKPGGQFYLTVLNTWDWRYGSGDEVEPDSFVLAEGPETGILHHFFSEDDLRAWLTAFDIIQLRRETGELLLSTRPEGEPVIRDAWAVLIARPR